MPRYVILRHEMPSSGERPLHWDVMFEWGSVLRTWALDAAPAPGRTIAAAPLADHRLDYLDYEGPISGDRGRVARWDRGVYTAGVWGEDRVEVDLRGERIAARVVIWVSEADQRWRFRWEAVETGCVAE